MHRQRLIAVSIVAAATALGAVGQAQATMRGHSMPRACLRWNVSGAWSEGQSNPAALTFHLKQRGEKLSGIAVNSPQTASQYGYSTGKIRGTLKGSRIHLVVHWQKSTVNGLLNVGNYVGTLTAHQMGGTGNNLAYDPSAHVSWSASGVARCVKH